VQDGSNTQLALEATNPNFIVVGLTPLGLEPTIYFTRSSVDANIFFFVFSLRIKSIDVDFLQIQKWSVDFDL
jgi:hypothetical protein